MGTTSGNSETTVGEGGGVSQVSEAEYVRDEEEKRVGVGSECNSVSAWPPALACRIHFAARLEPRNTTACFGTLAPHVDVVVDAPA